MQLDRLTTRNPPSGLRLPCFRAERHLQCPTYLTLVPLCRRHAFRKYDSTCLAVVGAQLWSLANLGTSSGEAHRLAARKTDMVRLDMFAVHQPQCRFFNRATRCSKEHTNPLTPDKAAKGAQNPFQLSVRTAVPRFGQLFTRGQSRQCVGRAQ
jgi:hypothetical protein